MTAGLTNQVWPSVFKIDPNTGSVTEELSGLTDTRGIAFDSKGTMFLSQWDRDLLLAVDPDTQAITTLASIPNPYSAAVGPDGNVYVVGGQTDYSRDQIYRVNPNTGATALFASGLPPITDIAFAAVSVPEPASITVFLIGAVGLLFRSWRQKTSGTVNGQSPAPLPAAALVD
ncbi:MAG: hypothetical protein RIK87_29950 [Fuerstiella sp.]